MPYLLIEFSAPPIIMTTTLIIVCRLEVTAINKQLEHTWNRFSSAASFMLSAPPPVIFSTLGNGK